MVPSYSGTPVVVQVHFLLQEHEHTAMIPTKPIIFRIFFIAIILLIRYVSVADDRIVESAGVNLYFSCAFQRLACFFCCGSNIDVVDGISSLNSIGVAIAVLFARNKTTAQQEHKTNS